MYAKLYVKEMSSHCEIDYFDPKEKQKWKEGNKIQHLPIPFFPPYVPY